MARVRRRAKQEKRPQRRQVPQEKKPEAGVRVRSRAAARSSAAPKAAEEPEYKRLYKPRVRSAGQGQAVLLYSCGNIWAGAAILSTSFLKILNGRPSRIEEDGELQGCSGGQASCTEKCRTRS